MGMSLHGAGAWLLWGRGERDRHKPQPLVTWDNRGGGGGFGFPDWKGGVPSSSCPLFRPILGKHFRLTCGQKANSRLLGDVRSCSPATSYNMVLLQYLCMCVCFNFGRFPKLLGAGQCAVCPPSWEEGELAEALQLCSLLLGVPPAEIQSNLCLPQRQGEALSERDQVERFWHASSSSEGGNLTGRARGHFCVCKCHTRQDVEGRVNLRRLLHQLDGLCWGHNPALLFSPCLRQT